MLAVNPILMSPTACWLTGTRGVAASLAITGPGSTNLWSMVALIGAATMLVGILQACRRKPGTAILALLFGAGLLSLYGAGTWSGRIRGPMTMYFVAPPVPPMPAMPRIDLSEISSFGEVTVTINQQQALEEQLDQLGGKFRKLRLQELSRYLSDEHTVLGLSELHDSATEARQEALERVAAQLRRQLITRVGPHTKLPVEKLDEHADDIDYIIADVVQGLANSAHVGIVTRDFGPPEAPQHRTAVRVDPERVAREISDRVSEFLDTKVAPWMRRAAGTTLSMFALGILVYLAFVFVDAGRRGHFAWPLRIVAAGAFVGICGALWYLVP